MAFIIKKIGSAATAKPAPQSTSTTAVAVKPSPLRTIRPLASIRPAIRPLARGVPLKPLITPRQQANLEDTGIASPKPAQPSGASGVSPLKYGDRSGPAYESCHIGTRVTITNGMFPWVKHYKPGDTGLVTHVGNNRDPMGIDDTSHLMHVIKIDGQRDGLKGRCGQTAALFRWEFQIGEIPAGNFVARQVVYE